MDELILHDNTRTQLERFMNNPSHAVLLTGPDGVGKTAVAEALIAHVLELKDDGALASHPYFLTIRPDGNSISIEAVRQLQRFLQLRTLGTPVFRRAIIIEHAHLLTIEAQNAFLKLLEEPPADTLIVLTVDHPRSLLPTILSRAQSITVHAPNIDQLAVMLSNAPKTEAERQQAISLSGGLPGLLHALLHDESHPLVTSIAQAKELLQAPLFERLALIDGLGKQKEQAMSVAEALERIAQTGLSGAAAKNDLGRIKQWHRIRAAAMRTREALERNANTKLALCDLCLHL